MNRVEQIYGKTEERVGKRNPKGSLKGFHIEDEAERGPWFKRYRFELVDMEVNEKDRENFRKDVSEFKKSVMEKEKAYEN